MGCLTWEEERRSRTFCARNGGNRTHRRQLWWQKKKEGHWLYTKAEERVTRSMLGPTGGGPNLPGRETVVGRFVGERGILVILLAREEYGAAIYLT